MAKTNNLPWILLALKHIMALIILDHMLSLAAMPKSPHIPVLFLEALFEQYNWLVKCNNNHSDLLIKVSILTFAIFYKGSQFLR